MKFLLIVLFLLPVIQLSRSIGCQTNFPAFEKLSRAIDITKFELFPEDITSEGGIAGQILDFKCDKHKKWQNIHNKQVYDLPDLIELVTNLPGKVEQKTEVFLNLSDYTKEEEARCKMVTPDLICNPISNAISSSNVQTNVSIAGSAHISLFTVKLALPSAENAFSTMKIFVNQSLPNNYAENPGKYQEFLTKFGTHFFQTATYGGLMQVSTNVPKDYALKHTLEALKAQANIFFMYKTGQGNQSPDKEFLQSIGMYYYGGNADLISVKFNLSSWTSSVSNYPWLVGGHLESIATLLPNGPKKNAVNTAIGVKLDYFYLDEMTRSLQFLKQHLKSSSDLTAANNFIAQVNAERVKVVPPHDRVLQLDAAIEGFINVKHSLY